MSLCDQILALLLPSPCLACDMPAKGSPVVLGLCAPCRARIKQLATPRCPRCAESLTAATLTPGFLCLTCRNSPPAYDLLVAVWSYEPPLDSVIRGLKFSRLPYLGRHLAGPLANCLRQERLTLSSVVPVPLHWRRKLFRGYNQAEEIARPLARSLGLPFVRALSRCRPTRPQARLPLAERGEDLRTAFRVRKPVDGQRVLLVDDVMTTGATLQAAASCLKGAGARAVIAAVAARTPRPGAS
jgi:ComF family protein